MGLSIHYSGKIKSETLIEKLTLETEDICQSLNWKYQVIKKPNEDQLYGICFSPDGCEPVFLTFLPGGRLCTPLNLMN
jgi:hypothetical protein